MTEGTNFLGIPVDGTISRGEKRARQKPLSDLTPVVQAILDDPAVARFGWRQYTPYFNDGDPCVFSAYGVWADPPAGVATEDGYDEDAASDGIEYDERWGKCERTWNRETGQYDYGTYQGPGEATYRRLMALGSAIDSGEFLDVLLEAFGDHASITITRESIRIEEYSHD